MNLPTFSRAESQAACVALTADVARLITADKDLYMKAKERCEVKLLNETKPEELPLEPQWGRVGASCEATVECSVAEVSSSTPKGKNKEQRA